MCSDGARCQGGLGSAYGHTHWRPWVDAQVHGLWSHTDQSGNPRLQQQDTHGPGQTAALELTLRATALTLWNWVAS